MRWIFVIILAGHGTIHLLGFMKAFNLANPQGLSQNISKAFGIIWLMAFFLFSTSLILFLFKKEYWWLMGILSVTLSQFLIFIFWKDAQYGTILNLLILIICLLSYSNFNFREMVKKEVSQMLTVSNTSEEEIITEQMIQDLPEAVQRWLNNSRIIGQPLPNEIYLEQEAQLLMKPEQQNWINAQAQQYYTIDPPAFNWSVQLKMFSILPISGRDKFEQGNGEMSIKLFSLIPIAQVKNNNKVNQASLQRFLAEIIWFPSAALQPYISWEAIDQNTAKASMSINGTKGDGVFHFDEEGNFEKFTCLRFKEKDDDTPIEWTVMATQTRIINGVKVPIACEAKWKLDNGDWTWLKIKITKLDYKHDSKI